MGFVWKADSTMWHQTQCLLTFNHHPQTRELFPKKNNLIVCYRYQRSMEKQKKHRRGKIAFYLSVLGHEYHSYKYGALLNHTADSALIIYSCICLVVERQSGKG